MFYPWQESSFSALLTLHQRYHLSGGGNGDYADVDAEKESRDRAADKNSVTIIYISSSAIMQKDFTVFINDW